MSLILIMIRLPLIIMLIFAGLIILVFFPKDNLKLTMTHHKISCIWMKVLTFLFGFKVIRVGKINKSACILLA